MVGTLTNVYKKWVFRLILGLFLPFCFTRPLVYFILLFVMIFPLAAALFTALGFAATFYDVQAAPTAAQVFKGWCE
jgi:hypothetical protein